MENQRTIYADRVYFRHNFGYHVGATWLRLDQEGLGCIAGLSSSVIRLTLLKRKQH